MAYIVFMTTRTTANNTGHEAQKGQDAMSKSSTLPVAEICLYGTSAVGAGYIVRVYTPGGSVSSVRLASADVQKGRSFTEAVWTALDLVRIAGFSRGIVHVYEPTGRRYAEVDLTGTPRYFGDLPWVEGGTVYVLSSGDLAAAAAATAL